MNLIEKVFIFIIRIIMIITITGVIGYISNWESSMMMMLKSMEIMLLGMLYLAWVVLEVYVIVPWSLCVSQWAGVGVLYFISINKKEPGMVSSKKKRNGEF